MAQIPKFKTSLIEKLCQIMTKQILNIDNRIIQILSLTHNQSSRGLSSLF